MKKLGIVLSVVLLIVVLLVFGLQMFLTKGLTTALNQGVFPAVKSRYGLDMSITNASVNLFRGSARLDGFAVRNLKGYENPSLLTFDTCQFDLEMLSLLKRDPIVIRLAEVGGATLVVERNSEKKFNVKELYDALKPVESKETPEPEKAPAPEPSAKPAKPIPIHIRELAVDTLVAYVDSGRNKTGELKLRLVCGNIFTVPAEGQKETTVTLQGSLANDKNSFATDLSAIIEPPVDPKNPSFRAAGSILDINADFLGDLLSKNNMESRSFSLKPSLNSTKGNLSGSQIDVVLNDLRIYGEPIGDTTLKLPVNGTLQHPTLDLTGALQSLFSGQAKKIGKAVGMRELKKQLGGNTNASPNELLMSGLTNNVKEVAESPALQQLIEQVAEQASPSNAAATNQTLGDTVGEALSEQLGKNVKELEGNEAVKQSLKGLGNSLFGK